MELKEVIAYLKKNRNEGNLAGMAGYGIVTKNCYGLSMPQMRELGKKIGTDHQMALALYRTGIHEARIIAGLIDDPAEVTEAQMEEWCKCFDSWDVTDQVTTILFDQTEFAWKKAVEWSKRKPEYEKRAGFTLMAGLAVHDRITPDEEFEKFYPFIEKGAADERNFVKKAVSWALRNIGKRSLKLNNSALKVAETLKRSADTSARWVGCGAVRELRSATAKKRITAAVKARKARHKKAAKLFDGEK